MWPGTFFWDGAKPPTSPRRNSFDADSSNSWKFLWGMSVGDLYLLYAVVNLWNWLILTHATYYFLPSAGRCFPKAMERCGLVCPHLITASEQVKAVASQDVRLGRQGSGKLFWHPRDNFHTGNEWLVHSLSEIRTVLEFQNWSQVSAHLHSKIPLSKKNFRTPF